MAKHAHSFWGRNWKLIVNLVTLALLGLLVFLIRDQLAESFRNLHRVDWRLLLLVAPLVAIGYHSQAKMYLHMFAMIGHQVGYRFMVKMCLELNFVNQVFPSGGVSGISYFAVRMRSADVSGTQAGLVQILRLLLVCISFEVLLILGLIALAVQGHASGLMLLVTGSVTTLLILVTAAFALVGGSERRIRRVILAILHAVNKLRRLLTRGKSRNFDDERVQRIIHDLHGTYVAIAFKPRELLAPFAWSLLLNLTAIGSIYTVYLAFGHTVNAGAIIVAYSVANFAGLVSVLPGGAGIYEALMTGVLAAGGISAAVSLPVTIMFRVLSTLIQLPPGYVLYHQSVVRTGRTPLDQPHAS